MSKQSQSKEQVVRVVGQENGRFVVKQGGETQSGGGQVVPFLWLGGFERWGILNRSVKTPQIDEAQLYPSLRLVRDGKVIDVVIPTGEKVQREADVPGLETSCEMDGLPTAAFLERIGLRVSMAKGARVLSKRLSRLFSPYRFWNFFNEEEVHITYSDELDGAVWDGIGLMSRHFLKRFTAEAQINWMRCGVSEVDQRRYTRELETVKRFEITIMTEQGQEKGDVLVVDALPDGADFLFPQGSTKREVTFHKGVFVGFKQPRHGKHRLRLDVQSLINLHGFLSPEQIMAWLEADTAEFLTSIESGETDTLLNNLLHVGSAEGIEKLSNWWLGDYFASGGKGMWFAGIVQALGRQRRKALRMNTQLKHRFPIPGGRYYIAPAGTVGVEVPPGHVHLSDEYASAFVNDDDWKTYIVSVLGGADGDDAVCVLPFTDKTDRIDSVSGEVTQRKRILIWRSPNQEGEWVTLTPTAASDDIGNGWPLLDESALPTRIDKVDDIEYGTLREPLPVNRNTVYSVAGMTAAICQAGWSLGVLGQYINVLMVCKAMFGRVPRRLPARLEAVIDGTVKDGRDLSPVRAWCEVAVKQLKRKGRVPAMLAERVGGMGGQAVTAHWFDQLLVSANAHITEMDSRVAQLALKTSPPLEVIAAGMAHQAEGSAVLTAYRSAVGQSMFAKGRVDYAGAYGRTVKALGRAGCEAEALAGVVAAVYVGGLTGANGDDVLWQVNEEDARPIAMRTVEMLRGLGVIGEPVWSECGAVLLYEDVPETVGRPVTFNGAWFNVGAAGEYAKMGDVPKAVAAELKQSLRAQAKQWHGVTLTLEERADRVVANTETGELFGYVQRGQEDGLLVCREVTIQYCVVNKEGNVEAVVV